MKIVITSVFLFLAFLMQGQTPDTAIVRLEIDSLIQKNNKLLKEQKYDQALEVLQQAEKKCQEYFGEETVLYATIINKVGIIHYYKGDLNKTEPFWLKTKNIREKVFGKEHPKYASSLNNLGALYNGMGKYEKCELLYLESKEINEKVFGNEHPHYADNLNNLGALYLDMGQFEKVEKLYLEAKEIWAKVYGKEHPDYAVSLNNLGILYSNMGQYEKAEPLYLEAKEISEKVFGKEHPDYATNLNSLGNLYWEMGQYAMAEILYLEAKEIREKVFGKEHPKYASSLNNLAVLYKNIGENEKAETLYLESIAITESVFLGKEHPDYAVNLYNLARLYRDMGQYEKAEPLYLESNEIRKKLLLKATRHLSEKDLLSYTTTFINDQNQFLSFANRRESMAGAVYNNGLFYKGFLLNAILQVNRLAQTDSISNDLFLRLKGYNQRLAEEYSKPVAERDSSAVPDLKEKANNIEKELTRSVAGFGAAQQQVKWQEVQSTLKSGEAAIEYVQYKFHNSDSTDSIIYAALLLQPGDKQPQFINLFEEKSLDALLAVHQERRSDYVNDLYSLEDRGVVILNQANKTLYELIWEPIEAQLKGVKKIYFSPSGLLHRINLGAIALDEDQNICDQYDLVQFNSTRQLVIPHQNKSSTSNALLMGGIEYDIDSLSINSNDEDLISEETIVPRSQFNFVIADSTLRGGSWNYLKYTEKEVTAIDKILSNAGFQSETKTAYEATEDLFHKSGRGNNSPRFIHLATHGFFFSDPVRIKRQSDKKNEEPAFKTSDHPMMRSGLILAGGNHVWQGNSPLPRKEDGILTAYEICQMDLSNTELVVLSACETGLGDIEGNEGVYGLQRAFKIAGVKYLIMSLWQVPDRETKDFMVNFYEHLLNDKMTIPVAFRTTQKEMKERFYNPYQWAGFVLVE